MLHQSGIYFLWAYAFSVYWWNLFFYPDPVLVDYIYDWTGLLAWGMRAAAWSRKRIDRAAKASPQLGVPPVLMLLGVAAIGVGLTAATFGKVWKAPGEAMLTG